MGDEKKDYYNREIFYSIFLEAINTNNFTELEKLIQVYNTSQKERQKFIELLTLISNTEGETNNNSKSLLEYIVKNGHLNILKKIEVFFFNENNKSIFLEEKYQNYGLKLIDLAIKNDYIDIFNFLIKQNIINGLFIRDNRGYNILHYIIMNYEKSDTVIKILEQNDFLINPELLFRKICNNSTSLKTNATNIKTPIDLVLEIGETKTEIFEILKFFRNKENNLLYIIMNKCEKYRENYYEYPKIDIVKKIIEQDEYINVKYNKGNNLLQNAIDIYNINNSWFIKPIIELLLEQDNLNLNSINDNNETVLDIIICKIKKNTDIFNNEKEEEKSKFESLILINDYLTILYKIVKLKNLNINFANKYGYYPFCLIIKIINNLNNEYKNTEQYQYIRGNLINIFNELIKRDDYCINLKDINGYSMLHYAIMYNNIDIFKIILKHKNIDINIKDNYGFSAFYHAVANRQLDIVKLLLTKKNININECINDNLTAFDLAVKNGDKEMLELLFNHKECNITDSDLARIIQLSIKKGTTEITEFFLKNIGIDKFLVLLSKNNDNLYLYFNKFFRGLFLSNNIIQKYDKLPVYTINNEVDLDLNIVDNYGKTLLHYAVEEKNQELCNLLLNSSLININIRDNNGETPIDIAIKNKDIKMTKLLLSRRESSLEDFKNKNDEFSPIFKNIKNRENDILNFIIDNEKDVDDINKGIGENGINPLNYAVLNNNYKAVDTLLKKGADISVKTNKNHTAFNFINYYNESPKIVNILLKNLKNKIKNSIDNFKSLKNRLEKQEKRLSNLVRKFENTRWQWLRNRYEKKYLKERLLTNSIRNDLKKQEKYNKKIKENFLNSLKEINDENLKYINNYDKKLIPSIESL